MNVKKVVQERYGQAALRVVSGNAKLAAARFENVGIEPTRVYSAEDARAFLKGAGREAERAGAEIDGKILGAFIRATKPSA